MAQAILGHLQTTLGYTHALPRCQLEVKKRLERGILFPNVPNAVDHIKEILLHGPSFDPAVGIGPW